MSLEIHLRGWLLLLLHAIMLERSMTMSVRRPAILKCETTAEQQDYCLVSDNCLLLVVAFSDEINFLAL